MSDTPRTDALHAKCIEIEALCWMAGREYVVMRELARTLERELATLRERLAEAERECEDWRKNAAAYRKDMLLAKDRAERAEQDAERYRFLRAETDRVDPVAAVSWKWKMNRESSEWANTSCAKSLDELCDGQIAARSAT